MAYHYSVEYLNEYLIFENMLEKSTNIKHSYVFKVCKLRDNYREPFRVCVDNPIVS